MSGEQLGLPGMTQTYACRITFSENNSGGTWWLQQEHYDKLFAAGWHPGRTSYNGSVRGAHRIIVLDAIDEGVANTTAYNMAVLEWEKLTGENSDDPGCSCCGAPYQFYDWDTPILLIDWRGRNYEPGVEQATLLAMFEED